MRHLIAPVLALAMFTTRASASPAAEYAKHFAALGQLSVAVAQAMPVDQYSFRPHPESMTFGELMNHIASTNFSFCAGLNESKAPNAPSPGATDKDAVLKYLGDSFSYCSRIISQLSAAQLDAVHDSPDGKLPGREVLLAVYVHVAHHRGQAEIYLRDKGIKPPPYRI